MLTARREDEAMPRDAHWKVQVEVVLLSSRRGGGLGFRVLSAALPAGAHPDEASLALAGFHTGRVPAGAISHATSWRFDGPARLVLTYTAVPDPDPSAAQALTDPSVICTSDPLRPSPQGLHAHHVAAHGARHLAYLAETDPSVVGASAAAPELWSALAAAVDRLPVAEHERAHALARQWGPDVGLRQVSVVGATAAGLKASAHRGERGVGAWEH